MSSPQIRGRFAPSPSGEMHLGNAWAALLAWLQVRQAGGTMILRMEDLDPDRSRSEYSEAIMRDLHWLGLDWDEGPDVGGPYGPYRQSERESLYREAINTLQAASFVYPCFCSRAEIRSTTTAPHGDALQVEYPGICRSIPQDDSDALAAQKRHSLRFRLTDEETCFQDGCFGSVTLNPLRELGDFVLRRSDGIHAYQLAVVVDDAAMNITYVLRGADLLISTARQLSLYRVFGYIPPEFTHVPLLFGLDGHRLSKRHGDISLRFLRDEGVSSQEIIGLLAHWAGMLTIPEKVHARELIGMFDPKRLDKDCIVVDPLNILRGRKCYSKLTITGTGEGLRD